MTSSGHTAAPWVFSPWHVEEGSPAVRSGTINGYIIATTASDDDAALIVKAVNNHEALVEALRRIGNLQLREANGAAEEIGDKFDCAWAVKLARAALKAVQS